MSWNNYIKIPEFLRISKNDVENVIRDINLKEGARVLDVGCGYGRISLFLKKAGYDVVSLDNDPYMIKNAKNNGLNAVLMSATNLEFPDKHFDLVLTDGLLEHFVDTEDIENIIREELRVSKGFVINFVPSNSFINTLLEIVQRVPKEYRYHDWLRLHQNVMRPRDVITYAQLKRLHAFIISYV